ncbi:hypothetical protein [Ilumatobacter sp.]|uniref:hypothetical protein n=1 Tax=Ilumatobacter sp. TaxID=1967498 RepID=UPI003C6F1AD6
MTDTDGDGVLDDDDVCPDTSLPDAAPTRGLKRNHYVADGAGNFGTSGYTVADAGGCSASQIIAAAELGKGHTKHGLSRGVLKGWVASVN